MSKNNDSKMTKEQVKKAIDELEEKVYELKIALDDILDAIELITNSKGE